MRDPLPHVDEYVLAARCPTCRAPSGQPCNAPRRGGFHAARQDKGAAHKRRDVGNAPWPEERVPGVRYDTL